jgi:hypothetical protein
MSAEEQPLKKNISFESTVSSSGMVEISLSNESLNIPETIKEEVFVQPVRRASQALKPVEHLDLKLLPLLLRFLDVNDLRACQLISWAWFKESSSVLYRHLQFSQLSGKRLEKLLVTLHKSLLTPQGRRLTQLDYSSLVRYLTLKNIVFEDDSQLQSWRLIRELICICAPSLVGLSFSIGDESFLDLPNDFVYLNTHIQLPNLKLISMASRCMRIPNKLVMELLRASPSNGLKSIKFLRCLYNFDASGWYLVCEKGGEELLQVSLTPSIGPNMLGWDEHQFQDGVKALTEACTKVRQLDLSGHAIPLLHTTLELMTIKLPCITHLYLPCNSNDAHLLALMKHPPWKNLQVLGLSCYAVEGGLKDYKKAGLPCDKFTDNVLVSFLDHCLDVETKEFQVYLPTYLLSLKTGKSMNTMDWLSKLIHVTRREGDKFWFKERIIISVPTSRMTIFF